VGSYSATIVWGDGHVTAGPVTANGPGAFRVTGSNTYSSGGTYSVKVFIRDTGGSMATAFSTVQVTAPALQPVPATLDATEGSAFMGMVGSFIDLNRTHPATDYRATITWGDGHVSAGTVFMDPLQADGFRVLGGNLYAEAGTYSVSVSVQSISGAQAAINTSANVADAALTATAASANPTEGAAFTGVVATFTDANPSAKAGRLLGHDQVGRRTGLRGNYRP